jgi:outer membrane protein OmpA-like peptidoglycan-associated protein
LAEILNKYSQYEIRIEGHANMIHWEDPQRAKREQKEELIPLSKDRADAIKDALVEFGVAESRMSTVGLGGSQPIIPFSDLENRWKNRRVEFILIK